MGRKNVNAQLQEKFLDVCEEVWLCFSLIKDVYSEDKIWTLCEYDCFQYHAKVSKIIFRVDHNIAIISWLDRNNTFSCVTIDEPTIEDIKNRKFEIIVNDIDIFINEFNILKREILKEAKIIEKFKKSNKEKFDFMLKKYTTLKVGFDINNQKNREQALSEIQSKLMTEMSGLVNMTYEDCHIIENKMIHNFSGEVIYPINNITKEIFDEKDILRYITVILDMQKCRRYLEKSNQEYNKKMQKAIKA